MRFLVRCAKRGPQRAGRQRTLDEQRAKAFAGSYNRSAEIAVHAVNETGGRGQRRQRCQFEQQEPRDRVACRRRRRCVERGIVGGNRLVGEEERQDVGDGSLRLRRSRRDQRGAENDEQRKPDAHHGSTAAWLTVSVAPAIEILPLLAPARFGWTV